MPEDLKAKKAQALSFADLVIKLLKSGATKEWGQFTGEMRGYAIFEGNTVDLHCANTMWAPYVKFEAHELMTIDEVKSAYRSWPE
jgi:hypothetical protein